MQLAFQLCSTAQNPFVENKFIVNQSAILIESVFFGAVEFGHCHVFNLNSIKFGGANTRWRSRDAQNNA